MSYPQYLTKIINFSSNIKEVQNVRQQITNFLPKLQKEIVSQRHVLQDKKGKTMMNFNIVSISKPPINENIIFSGHSSNKMMKQDNKRKSTISFAKLNEIKSINLQEGQEQNMIKWRQQILHHLNPHKQQAKIEIQLQKDQPNSADSPKIYQEQYQKQPIFKLKKSQTMSSAMMRTFKTRLNSRHETAIVNNNAHNPDQNRKKIIIINPKPLYQESKQKQKIKFTVFKSKKSMFLFKKKKSESNLNTMERQSHSNFNALIPFFGAKQLVAEQKLDNNDEKKKLFLQLLSKKKMNTNKQENVLKRPQRFIQISAWQTKFQ